MRGVARVAAAVAAFCEAAAVVALSADVLLVFTGTMSRYIFALSILRELDDVSLILQNAIAFVGGTAMFRRGGDIAFRVLVERCPPQIAATLRAGGIWFVVLVACLTLSGFPHFFASDETHAFPNLPLSQGWLAIWIGVGYALVALFGLEKAARLPLRANLAGLGIVVLTGGALVLLHASRTVDPMVAVAVASSAAFLLGVPIAFVLATGGLTYVLLTGTLSLQSVPYTFTNAISSALLMAIPFFMIAGVLMEATGLSASLVALFERWVGHWQWS